MIYIIYILGRIIPAGLGLCTVLMLSHISSPETYGEYAVSLAFSTILNLIFFQWNRSSVTRHAAYDSDNITNVIGSSIFIHLVNLSLVSIIAFLYSYITGYAATYIVLMAVACSTSDFFLELARATGKAKQYSLNYAVRQIAFMLLSFVFLKFNLNILFGNAIVWAYVISFLVSSLPFAVSYIRSYSVNISRAQLEMHSRFGLPLVLNFSLSSFINQIDKIIVDWFLGKEIAGVYALSVDMTKQLILTLMEAVNLASFPSLVKVYERGDFAKTRLKMQQNLDILLGLSVPATIGFIIVMPEISGSIIGAEFAREFLQISPIIAFASFARGMRVYYFDQAFHLSRETFKPAINSMITLVVLVTGSLFLVTLLGTTGVALAVLISSLLSCLLSFGVGRSSVHLPVSLQRLGVCVFCTFVMAGAVYGARNFIDRTLVGGLIQSIIGIFSYGTCCLALNYAGSRDYIIRRLRK